MTHPPRSDAPAIVAAALIGGWVVTVTLGLQILGWGGEQLLLVFGWDRPWYAWPAVTLFNAALVAGPAALVAFVPRSPAVRATGRAWLAAAAGLAVLGLARAVPAAEPELYLAVLAVLAAGLSVGLSRPRGSLRSGAAGTPGTALFAVAGGALVLLPWLWLGALGGVLETLLALAAAAAVGWLAATVLGGGFWSAFGAGRWRRILLGGLVAGVALMVLAGGVGASGAHLPLLLILPALGFAAAALPPVEPAERSFGEYRPAGGGWLPAAVLLGVAALGPLGFVDPEEITLFLLGRDVPFWAAVATAGSLLVALLLAAGYAVGLGGRRQWRPAVAAGVAGLTVLGGAVVHVGLGQPGFHGERLFVVLADQAPLAGLPTGTGQTGRDARADAVYQRLVAHGEATQADLRAELDRWRLPYTPYYLVNAIEVSGGPEVRAWLARRPEVDRVLRSQRLRPLPATGPTDSGTAGLTPDEPGWNIEQVRADRVWSELGVTGEGIIVGTSDSGVDGEHPALAEGFRGDDDSWFDPWRDTGSPTDRSGHGTHTLGSAVGRGGIGVAPGADWTGCVNLDRNLGNPARYLDCLQFMLAPFPPGGDPWRDGRPERAPHVLTNSWGCPPVEGCDPESLRPATAALHAAGIMMVAAAGNAGPFCESIQDPPARYPDVLTVGAVDRDEGVAFFSSRGPVAGTAKPDLVAPGDEVLSAMPGGGFARLAGTSMAAPHVAGAVALMWSANPELIGDVDTTATILRDTAREIDVEPSCGTPADLTGTGLLDTHAAVQAALG